jgi:hypothetical protein
MAHFAVRISGEGLGEINGEPLVPEPDQSVHEAVLDRLQQYAQERAAAVEATVNDGPAGAHFVLQVAPDGSSRLLEAARTTDRALAPTPLLAPDPTLTPDSALAPDPDPAPDLATTTDPALTPDPTLAPDPNSTPAPTPVPASAITAAVARARAAATASPSSVPSAAPAPVPGPVPAPPAPPPPSHLLPPELAERIAHINALATTGRLEAAAAGATALREALTRSRGTEHPDALEALAMEAYLAHLRGDHREATALALSVARVLCGAGAPQAPAAVARAAAAWQRLEDDAASEIHGNELLHMWDRLRGGGRLSPADERLARRVRAQVEALSAYV